MNDADGVILAQKYVCVHTSFQLELLKDNINEWW